VITPGYFLGLNPNTGIPNTDDDEDNDPNFDPKNVSSHKMLEIWKKGNKLLNVFWSERIIFDEFKGEGPNPS